MFWLAVIVMVVAVGLMLLHTVTPGQARKYDLVSGGLALAFIAVSLQFIYTGVGGRLHFG